MSAEGTQCDEMSLAKKAARGIAIETALRQALLTGPPCRRGHTKSRRRLTISRLARLPHRSPHGGDSHPLAVEQQASPEDSG